MSIIKHMKPYHFVESSQALLDMAERRRLTRNHIDEIQKGYVKWFVGELLWGIEFVEMYQMHGNGD